jgi:hypothetical protein
MKWTAAKVREELPQVQIHLNGRVFNANVSGRRNAFATVWTREPGFEFSVDVSWNTLARCLNSGHPVQV